MHYHTWHMAYGGKALFRVERVFNTHQAARQWSLRRMLNPELFTVRRCTDERCTTRGIQR